MTAVICVVGAGSIGCYVGGRLAAAGSDVVLVGRERLAAQVRAHGLRVTDHLGADLGVPAPRFTTDLAAAAEADLVLVAVKSRDTAEVAASLRGVLHPGTVVVSLQNGIGNADALAAGLGEGPRVVAGMVPFNVVRRDDGGAEPLHVHQGSEGDLEVADDPALAPFEAAFAAAGLPLRYHANMTAVAWAKLLLNLNNAVNALSDRPLREELATRDYRRCLAAAQAEALGLMRAAGIEPARITPVPPRVLPAVLRLPDAVFTRVAARMLAIDPHARSSMWEDLRYGRETEVEAINGEIVRLAERLGRTAPVNRRLTALVHDAEVGGRRAWAGPELRRAVLGA